MQAAQVVVDELRLEEQILRGIADDGQLGKDDNLGGPRLGAVEKLDGLAAIAGDVADGRIHLGQGDAHVTQFYAMAFSPRTGPTRIRRRRRSRKLTFQPIYTKMR